MDPGLLGQKAPPSLGTTCGMFGGDSKGAEEKKTRDPELECW